MDLDKATKLGKIATARANWEWCGGMLTTCGLRLSEGGDDYIIGYKSGPTKDGGGHVDTLAIDKYTPDFRDDATLGCLLALVRKSYQSPNIFPEYDEAEGWSEGCALWRVRMGVEYLGTGKTEAEALVDAFTRSAGPFPGPLSETTSVESGGGSAGFRRAEDVLAILEGLIKKHRERTCHFDHEAWHAEGASEALEEARENILRFLSAIPE